LRSPDKTRRRRRQSPLSRGGSTARSSPARHGPAAGRAETTQGWLPIPVIEYRAKYLDMPYIRAMEVASFYTMFNLVPVGRYHVQVCGTTPCMLRGSDDVLKACYAKGMKKGRTTKMACSP
jgi:NADH:ubiquinone oxidoreductase subunit E